MELHELLELHQYNEEIYENILSIIPQIPPINLLQYNFQLFLQNVPIITESIIKIIPFLLNSPQKPIVIKSKILNQIRWCAFPFFSDDLKCSLIQILESINNETIIDDFLAQILRSDLSSIISIENFHQILLEFNFPNCYELAKVIKSIIQQNQFTEIIESIIFKYKDAFLDIFDFSVLQCISAQTNPLRFLELIDMEYNNSLVLNFYINFIESMDDEVNLNPLFNNIYIWENYYDKIVSLYIQDFEKHSEEIEKLNELVNILFNISPGTLKKVLIDVPLILNSILNNTQFINAIDELLLKSFNADDIKEILDNHSLDDYDASEYPNRVYIESILKN